MKPLQTIRSVRAALLVMAVIFSPVAHAIWIDAAWDGEFRRKVSLRCAEAEREVCVTACREAETCAFLEGFCHNCAGTMNPELKRFFESVGSEFVPGPEYPLSDGLALIAAGDFVSIGAESVYNYLTPFNSPEMRARFGQLCPDAAPGLVFWRVERGSRRLLQPEFVVCPGRTGSLLFRMKESGKPQKQNPTP